MLIPATMLDMYSRVARLPCGTRVEPDRFSEHGHQREGIAMAWRRMREQALLCGSATLHEAMGRRGALPSAIKPAYEGATLAGPAFPVKSPVGDNLWIHHALYAAEPGDVLVVDVPAGEDYGYWGEILSVAAQVRHLGGVVITGGVRDV